MTENQKKEITAMRNGGATFADIADALGLSPSAVKSYYRRNTHPCKNCGKAIMQPPGTREKKFCSNKCRMDWWNSHKDMVNKKAVYGFVCEYCGGEFQAYGNSHRKYCSPECYRKARFGGDSR